MQAVENGKELRGNEGGRKGRGKGLVGREVPRMERHRGLLELAFFSNLKLLDFSFFHLIRLSLLCNKSENKMSKKDQPIPTDGKKLAEIKAKGEKVLNTNLPKDLI